MLPFGVWSFSTRSRIFRLNIWKSISNDIPWIFMDCWRRLKWSSRNRAIPLMIRITSYIDWSELNLSSWNFALLIISPLVFDIRLIELNTISLNFYSHVKKRNPILLCLNINPVSPIIFISLSLVNSNLLQLFWILLKIVMIKCNKSPSRINIPLERLNIPSEWLNLIP